MKNGHSRVAGRPCTSADLAGASTPLRRFANDVLAFVFREPVGQSTAQAEWLPGSIWR